MSRVEIRGVGRVRPSSEAGLLLITLAVGACLAWWTWGKWLDPMVDFGRELYVPWQILEGRHLYRDLAYFNGPFSPYWNSMVFRVLGVSLRSMVIVNLLIIAMITCLVFEICYFISNRLTAFAASLTFMCVFAFAHLIETGNYNFVTPYSHEATHGTLFSLAAIACLIPFLKRGQRRYALASGLCLGLVALGKPEFLLAAITATTFAVVAQSWFREPRKRSTFAVDLLSLLGPAALVVGAALVLLSGTMPWQQASSGLLGSWSYIFDPRLHQLPFYGKGLGTADISGNVRLMAEWSLLWILAVLPGSVAAFSFRNRPRHHLLGSILLSVGVAALMLLNVGGINWLNLARPMPLFLSLIATILASTCWRRRRTLTSSPEHILALSLTIFALVLLAKILFAARFHHYGFALGLPGALVLVVALVSWIPEAMSRRGWNGNAFTVVALAVLAVLVLIHLQLGAVAYAAKTTVVASGGDSFFASDHGSVVQHTLDSITSLPSCKDSLAVLPEGVMLNYLLRIQNPTPYNNFMPPEFIMFGEEAILTSFRETSPSCLVLTNRRASEYGFKLIGRGYGESITEWIEREYALLERIEQPNLNGKEFSFFLVLGRFGA